MTQDYQPSAGAREKVAELEAALRAVSPPGEMAALLAGLGDLVQRMDRYDHDRDDPVREIMARLGDRWSTLIMLILTVGAFRHATLRRLVSAMSAEGAISQRMLTLRLRALERDGMVARTVTPTVPPRVDYALTPMGRELIDIVDGLLRWIEAHNDEIVESRKRFGKADD